MNKNFKYLSTAACLLGLLMTGCSDTTLGSFSASENLPSPLKIPGTTLITLQTTEPLSFEFDLNITESEDYSKNDFDYVTEVTLKALQLSILPISESPDEDPAGEDGNMDDFDFITGLEIFLKATIDGQLQEVRVASLPDGDPQFGSGTRVLNLTVTNADIRDYIEAPGGYVLRVSVAGSVPPDYVIADARVDYRVGVGFR